MTDRDRPLVTFALFAFNQEKYVVEAARAALNQTYSPLQIVFSDDCSTDGTFDLIKKVAEEYRGPHALTLSRPERNLGIGRHINSVMRLAQGELIVVAAGDDISFPNRVERLVGAWTDAHREPDLLCSDFRDMSEAGDDLGVVRHTGIDILTLAQIARNGNVVPGSTAAWTRRLWDRFGDLPEETVQEDQVLPFRAMLGGGILKLDEPLVRHRSGVSTWLAAGAIDYREAQRRAGVVARNVLRNTLTARADALRAGRSDLVPLIEARLREAQLMDHICNEDLPPFREVLRVVAGAGHRMPLMRAYAKRKFPRAHRVVFRLRARKARSRTPG